MSRPASNRETTERERLTHEARGKPDKAQGNDRQHRGRGQVPKPARTKPDRGRRTPSATPGPSHAATPKHAPRPSHAPKAKPPRSYLVTRVVDGDTVELGNKEVVRIVGIDTPEVGECGYDAASANMARLVLGKRVRLTTSDEDRDQYGRLLRYVDVGRVDVGLHQVRGRLASARYDSRDGYGFHPRENRYIAADRATPDNACHKPRPRPASPQSVGRGCAPGYNPCLPPYPPDVDCADVAGPVRVRGLDPHGLDADDDGVACE